MAQDVVTIITQDHREVAQMLDRLEQQQGDMQGTFATMAAELTAHSKAEESVVYPAIERAVPQESGDVHDARQEHAEVEQLLQQMASLSPEDAEFTQLLRELKQNVEHHVSEEENDVLPPFAQAVDQKQLEDLGQQFQARKQQELQEAKRQFGQ